MRISSDDHDKAAAKVLSREAEAPPLAVSIPEARRQLGGVGKTAFYGLVKRHEIQIAHVGNRSVVPYAELQRVLAECLNTGGNATRDRAQALAARSVQARKSTALKSETKSPPG